jgi:hypothetical protein
MKRLAAKICVSPKAFDKNNIAKDQTMPFRPRRPPKTRYRRKEICIALETFALFVDAAGA